MRPRAIIAGAIALAAIVGLVLLGNWQVRRLAWKRELIARVDARVHEKPRAAAPRGIDAAAWQYVRIRTRGVYRRDAQTLVQAATERGAGWWVLTPIRTDAGRTILINRGFVSERRAPAPPAGIVTVTGLLRVSEPGGGFLRDNDPAADRWYSRDVGQIARARRLGDVAPWFLDADAAADAPGQPVGGLTVIRFPNNHLIYAITWYGLAMMVAGVLVVFLRIERRRP